MTFPENFTWGAAASSYQIEGAKLDDGKGLSIWDTFCEQPEKIWENNNGSTACNHYHLFRDDVKLMAEIGLKAYRLSISWPRVLPKGTGQINLKGLDFYDKLVDELLKNNIEPWVTLFHWDYPYELFARGGWLNPDSPDWFAEYANVIVNKLSDRVKHWMTLNEPQVFIGMGHQKGLHAPGYKSGFRDILLAAHHSLLAHGKAVQSIRALSKQKSIVGAAPVGVVFMPQDNTAQNIEIARKKMFSVENFDVWNNCWFADPMVLGEYPKDGLKMFEEFMPEIKTGDLKLISQPLDFYGANIYMGSYIDESGKIELDQGPAYTTMGWRITPPALYWGPRFLYERYKLPVVVTENGMANCDWIHSDGKIHDPQRIDYVNVHLHQLKKAIADGIPVTGYFLWSVMDNFEWEHGYKQRFGLIYVDYKTQKRYLKDSAYWYKKTIIENGKSIL